MQRILYAKLLSGGTLYLSLKVKKVGIKAQVPPKWQETATAGGSPTFLVSLSPIVEGQSASKEPMEVTGGQEHTSDPFTILSPQSQSVSYFQVQLFSVFYKC